MASVELEDIWDAPVEDVTPQPATSNFGNAEADDDEDEDGARPRKSKGPLFLPSDDDEPSAPKSTSARPDIDALFEDLDAPEPEAAFQDLAPALDIAALRREADERNARAARAEFGGQIKVTQPTQANQSTQKRKGKAALDDDDADAEGDGEKKKKKKKALPKMDEARLLGKDGFPQLIKDTQYFKPRGKGQEAVDLDRVLQTYQFWAHKMYPKTKFRDTVERVEKLCHSKRMHVALSVWRDESKGLINGIDVSTLDDPEGSDSEVIDLTDAAPGGSSPQSSRPSSPARPAVPRVVELDDEDDLFTSRPPSLPPATPSPGPSTDDFDLDMIDMDALLEEEAALQSGPPATHAYKTPVQDADDDDAMWDALEMDPAPPPPPKQRPVEDDDDEDMWDLVREAEQEEERAAQAAAAAGKTTTEQRKPTNDEGWDDMYL
ncbi:Swi3-domain-containing protein [Artomyces pyxidatus]|uniref:Swi3-domain-containing protein n=1 Tax=Artomyces pyxidatus TaxID=48021 RepID=A0ACB8TA13_9AGAM|nr:Swi3-domain-containing protein [Artomyces pyxidatus]